MTKLLHTFVLSLCLLAVACPAWAASNDFTALTPHGIWDFEQNALDTTANNNDLTEHNTPGYSNASPPRADSDYGYYVDFADASDELMYLIESSLTGATAGEFPGENGWTPADFTVFGWVQADSLEAGSASYDAIVSVFWAGKFSWYVLSRESSGAHYIEFGIGDGGSNVASLQNTNQDIATGTWYFIACVFDYNGGTNNDMKVRVHNGSSWVTDATTTTNYDCDGASGHYFQFARLGASTSYTWDGKMEQFGVVPSAVSDADLDLIRLGTYGAVGGIDMGVAGWWHLYHH